jgi:hypothetical protein
VALGFIEIMSNLQQLEVVLRLVLVLAHREYPFPEHPTAQVSVAMDP